MPDGAMDSQDVVAWGKVIPEIYGHEKQRIEDLCVWGKKFGLDGFVRYVPALSIYNGEVLILSPPQDGDGLVSRSLGFLDNALIT